MRWSAYSYTGVVAIFTLGQTTSATMPVAVPGEFDFPGNFNPLVFPSTKESESVQTRRTYADGLKQSTNDEVQKDRIEHALGDYDWRYTNWKANYAQYGNKLSCNDEQYNLAKTAFTEALYLAETVKQHLESIQSNPTALEGDILFRQIFGDLLPKHQIQFKQTFKGKITPGKSKPPAETPQQRQAMLKTAIAHVIRVYTRNAELARLVVAAGQVSPAVKPMTGQNDPSWIKFACLPKCDLVGFEYAFVQTGADVINLCPKFFNTKNILNTIPRTASDPGAAALCKANSGFGIGKQTLMASGVATILHEIQHTYWQQRAPGGSLWSDDHAYGINALLGTTLRAIPGKKYRGSILNLTPQEARGNADSYSWYALLHIRRKICKINKIDTLDKVGCFRSWGLKLADNAAASSSDSVVGDDPDPNPPADEDCDNTECTAPGGGTGKVRRSLDGRAAICCRPGTKSVETKDPKTGKTKMDCVPDECPAGQIATKKTDPKTKKVTTTCSCPAGQISKTVTNPTTKKATTTCTCPPGQLTTTKTDPTTKKPTIVCSCPAGQTLKPTKNPRTGKTTTACACPAGKKASTQMDPKTRKNVTTCIPIASTAPKQPPKTPPAKKQPVVVPKPKTVAKPAKKGPRRRSQYTKK